MGGAVRGGISVNIVLGLMWIIETTFWGSVWGAGHFSGKS